MRLQRLDLNDDFVYICAVHTQQIIHVLDLHVVSLTNIVRASASEASVRAHGPLIAFSFARVFCHIKL